ncbi:MAG: M20 family metallopeptidase [Candidatus Heimdallarchaeota archaeon]|nr:M20 family metallopeptidase [Candidatus Heimdallarchaeota archaeon]
MMREKVQKLVQRMVQSDSSQNTLEVALIYQDFLLEHGIDAKIDEYSQGQANVEARLGSSNSDSIVISGHLDTVPTGKIEEWNHKPFSGHIENGFMYGRGSCDMKSGTGVLAGVLAELVSQEADLSYEVILAATAEEETGLVGAKHFTNNGIMNHASHLLITEPTGLGVAIMEKGVMWVEISAHGKQAHGSRPDLGHNAIEGLARLLPELYAAIPEKTIPELGQTTLNVGLISGGTVANVVPGHAVVTCDIRLTPGVEGEEVTTALQKIIDEKSTPEIRYELDIQTALNAPALLTADRKFGELLAENNNKYTGTKPELGGMYYATDGAAFMEHKTISFAIYGPGSTELLHQTNERVNLAEIDISRKVVRDTLLSLEPDN